MTHELVRLKKTRTRTWTSSFFKWTFRTLRLHGKRKNVTPKIFWNIWNTLIYAFIIIIIISLKRILNYRISAEAFTAKKKEGRGLSGLLGRAEFINMHATPTTTSLFLLYIVVDGSRTPVTRFAVVFYGYNNNMIAGAVAKRKLSTREWVIAIIIITVSAEQGRWIIGAVRATVPRGGRGRGGHYPL
jgi:hypothetical protein